MRGDETTARRKEMMMSGVLHRKQSKRLQLSPAALFHLFKMRKCAHVFMWLSWLDVSCVCIFLLFLSVCVIFSLSSHGWLKQTKGKRILGKLNLSSWLIVLSSKSVHTCRHVTGLDPVLLFLVLPLLCTIFPSPLPFWNELKEGREVANRLGKTEEREKERVLWSV